eukprot:5923598-Karenia_brevis.AAC.1
MSWRLQQPQHAAQDLPKTPPQEGSKKLIPLGFLTKRPPGLWLQSRPVGCDRGLVGTVVATRR